MSKRLPLLFAFLGLATANAGLLKVSAKLVDRSAKVGVKAIKKSGKLAVKALY